MATLDNISVTSEKIEKAAGRLASATKAWGNLPLDELSPERLEDFSKEISDLASSLSEQVTVFNFRNRR